MEEPDARPLPRWRLHVRTSAGTDHLFVVSPEGTVASLRGEWGNGERGMEREGEPSGRMRCTSEEGDRGACPARAIGLRAHAKPFDPGPAVVGETESETCAWAHGPQHLPRCGVPACSWTCLASRGPVGAPCIVVLDLG